MQPREMTGEQSQTRVLRKTLSPCSCQPAMLAMTTARGWQSSLLFCYGCLRGVTSW